LLVYDYKRVEQAHNTPSSNIKIINNISPSPLDKKIKNFKILIILKSIFQKASGGKNNEIFSYYFFDGKRRLMTAKLLFKWINILILVALVSFIGISCKTILNSVKNQKQPEQQDTTPTREVNFSPPTLMTSDLPAEARALAEEMKWILNPVRESNFAYPLVLFYVINNRYPNDIGEWLDSGLPIAWPANPATGEPFKIVKKIEPKKDDLGKIVYVRESDLSAHFEIIDFHEKMGGYYVREIPYPPAVEGWLEETRKERLDLEIEDNFQHRMSIVILALQRPEYRFGEKVPSGFEEATHGNFFLIKENIQPSFISDDPSRPLFLERGLALLDGRAVKFAESTFRSLTPTGREYVRHLISIAPLVDSFETWNDEETWARLTNKEYYYSTRMLLDGTLKIPDGVLISKAEILGQ